MTDISISVENLSKSYLIGHNASQAQRYTTLRDVLARNIRNVARKTRDMFHGRAIVQGDEVEEFWALKEVSFEVKQGDRVGIIGRNGAGKSTLLKLLSRVTEPTKGRIQISGRVASLLEVGTGFHPELSGRENIFLNGAILGMSRREIQRKFDEIVAFAEVDDFLDTPVKRYSSGMYVRLAFAVAAHLESEVLLVDEVLAVGDMRFQDKCLGKMESVSSSGRTVLFVSHNLDSIRKLCLKGIFLEQGRLNDVDDIESIVENYVAQYRHAESSSIIDIEDVPSDQFSVKRIEILNAAKTKPLAVKTWDDAVFRIYFNSPHPIESGSVVLKITSLTGSTLALLSTQPDQQFSIPFRKGENVVDCRVSRFPLSAGQYLIGAGLAIPNREWLSRSFEAGVFTVHNSDVYNSGMAPNSQRYQIAMDAKWEI
ncbi:MAG: ABC transporter ATP-binding protein [Proteobacteria bacterium]|nr:ABC transporter ATP-binding protein [Pseudomonadota bacterium]